MLSIKTIRKITEEILSRYNRRPEGWSILVDRRGNVFVLGPDLGYWLRMVWLNPYEYTGVGVEVGDPWRIRRMVEGLPSYGLRPLPERTARRLFTAMQRNGRVESSLVERLLNKAPVPTTELEARHPDVILRGPVISHPDLGVISEGQRKLERKLASEAEKLFRKKHPLRSRIYT